MLEPYFALFSFPIPLQKKTVCIVMCTCTYPSECKNPFSNCQTGWRRDWIASDINAVWEFWFSQFSLCGTEAQLPSCYSNCTDKCWEASHINNNNNYKNYTNFNKNNVVNKHTCIYSTKTISIATFRGVARIFPWGGGVIVIIVMEKCSLLVDRLNCTSEWVLYWGRTERGGGGLGSLSLFPWP